MLESLMLLLMRKGNQSVHAHISVFFCFFLKKIMIHFSGS